MTGRLLTSVALVFLCSGPSALAQDVPSFEVVSVKPNTSGSEASASYVQAGGRYTAINVTLRMLVKTAYQVHDTQVIDAPGWVDVDRFDVSARAAEAPSPGAFIERARLMLRPMLADRFKLVLRTERREIPVYGLVPARADGRFGPQFMRTDAGSCGGPDKAVLPAAGAAEESPALPCKMSFLRPTHAGARGAELSTLMTHLRSGADRVVVDRTGLSGPFDWDLQWTRDPLAAGATGTGVSLFTAVREQLGLRLDPQRGIVDVLVVERVERPDPD